MKASEAPPPGWYPDPEGGSRLRYWEGTDWSDRYRARPLVSFGTLPVVVPPPAGSDEFDVRVRGPADSAAWVEQMRLAARGEADRAVQQIEQRMRQATAEFKPLVTEYTSRLVRLVKRLVALMLILLVAYFVFQMIAQQSLLDWLGDRIDNLTDEDSLGLHQVVFGT